MMRQFNVYNADFRNPDLFRILYDSCILMSSGFIGDARTFNVIDDSVLTYD